MQLLHPDFMCPRLLECQIYIWVFHFCIFRYSLYFTMVLWWSNYSLTQLCDVLNSGLTVLKSPDVEKCCIGYLLCSLC